MIQAWYESLADNKQLEWLMYLAEYDERVYEVVARRGLLPDIVALLPSAQAAHFLSRGMVYDPVNALVIKHFVRICMFLSQYTTITEGAALAALIGNCGLPEQYRGHLFSFSETYRHMILSKSYIVQRAVVRLLAFVFCDDVLSDAVAQLQYKTDIINHVNKMFTDTPDFISWRFSVRVLSLAGGFNEDRSDVEYTETLTQVVTRMVPEFLLYFTVTFCYAMMRFYPRRVRGITPRWLARHRAIFSGVYCGVMGVVANSFSEYRARKHRVLYELRKSKEMRRRRGAERRGTPYEPNAYFDSLEGVTRRVFSIQCQSYLVVGTMLAASLVPLTKVTFPKWMGDVAWRHPMLPRLFPSLMGLHAASRCAVPFVLAPFALTTILTSNSFGCTLYDRYVEWRYRLWHRKTDVKFDTGTVIPVDVTNENRPRT